MQNVENGETYFKNLAVFTPQDFKIMVGHYTTLCMKGLKQSYYHTIVTIEFAL